MNTLPERRARVVALEAELDELALAIERCRKTVLLSRATAAVGGVAVAVGLWRSDARLIVFGFAALLGGLVLAGSTGSTRTQLLARMAACEAERGELIDTLVASTPSWR